MKTLRMANTSNAYDCYYYATAYVRNFMRNGGSNHLYSVKNTFHGKPLYEEEDLVMNLIPLLYKAPIYKVKQISKNFIHEFCKPSEIEEEARKWWKVLSPQEKEEVNEEIESSKPKVVWA